MKSADFENGVSYIFSVHEAASHHCHQAYQSIMQASCVVASIAAPLLLSKWQFLVTCCNAPPWAIELCWVKQCDPSVHIWDMLIKVRQASKEWKYPTLASCILGEVM